LRGWHLQGEELEAYVAGQMDELDQNYANLRLRECTWCREAVSRFSEFTSKLDFISQEGMTRLKRRVRAAIIFKGLVPCPLPGARYGWRVPRPRYSY
jgi:hypothetical protein